jgi:nucleoside phosphorylase
MVDMLVCQAKCVLQQAAITANPDGTYLSGLQIWIGASRHRRDIADVADAHRRVYEALGATVILDRSQYPACFGPAAHEQIRNSHVILMFAATPGVSAKALELCLDGVNAGAITTRRPYVYLPSEYAQGFICGRLNCCGGRVRLLAADAFCLLANDLFLQCLTDICDEECNRRRQIMLKRQNSNPTIAIVTALPCEYDAVRRVLKNPRLDPRRKNGNEYDEYIHGTFASDHGGHHDVVVARSGKGNLKAALVAGALLRDFPTIEIVLVVGVAAAVPNIDEPSQHVRLGDIVLSDEHGIVQYDMVKQDSVRTRYNPPPRPPSHEWLTRAENHVGSPEEEPRYWTYLDELLDQKGVARPRTAPLRDSPWVDSRKAVRQPVRLGHSKTRPYIHFGPIASANTVLKTARIRTRLQKQFGVKAVEMEASGIAEATWQSGKGYFVIRGTCDFANDDKNKAWQPYAAAAAAAFARDLIETMIPHTRREPGP